MPKKKTIEKYLPIGTLVLLKKGVSYAMITSYFIFPTGSDEKKEMYDYGACEYPEGVIDSKNAIAFNHEDIDKVIHLGFKDEDFDTLNKALLTHGESLKREYKKMIEKQNKE